MCVNIIILMSRQYKMCLHMYTLNSINYTQDKERLWGSVGWGWGAGELEKQEKGKNREKKKGISDLIERNDSFWECTIRN